MNIITLSLANLRFNRINSLFNILILALGIATIITLLHVGEQLEKRLQYDLQGIDLVVGAKGSPLQLILSSVFHLDIPTGNIPLREAEIIRNNPLVKKAIPVSLGDSYHGFHIVGTNNDYIAHYHAAFAEGSPWNAPMEAVLGSDVAKESGLSLGNEFAGSHGLTGGGEVHADFPYRVVGILQPTHTVLDRLVLTDTASVWNIHEHDPDEAPPPEREITALLITYKSPLAAVTMPRMVNKTSSLQAASPAFEVARLVKMLGMGSDVISLFGGVLITIAAIGFFITLFGIIHERRYDIALMRTLGATRRVIVGFVLMEGIVLGIAGTIVGALLAHGMIFALSSYIQQSKHIYIPAFSFSSEEITVMLAALGLSIVSAIIPAILAYRLNVAQLLSKGS